MAGKSHLGRRFGALLWHLDLSEIQACPTPVNCLVMSGREIRVRRACGARVDVVVLQPGRMVLLPEGSSSDWTFDRASTVVDILMPQAVIAEMAEREGFGPVMVDERFGPEDPALSGLGHAMESAVRDDTAEPLFVDSLCTAIASRVITAHAHRGRASAPPRGGLAPWQVARANAALAEVDSAELTLADLAELVGLSAAHLARAL